MSIFDQICSAVGSDFVDGQTVNQQYQPPQQRTWVGLTNEEILELFGVKGSADSDINPLRLLSDSRRIEAKLKEKNT